MIKAVTFDVFGTLFDWRRGCRAYLLEGLGIGSDEAEELLNRFRERQFLYMLLDNCLARRMSSFLELTRLAFLYASGSMDMKPSGDAVQGFLDTWGRLPPYDDSIPALDALRSKGYRTAMLSNGDRDTLRSLAAQLGGRIDVIISSDDAGAYKPSPAIYEVAAEKLGLGVDEIVHVAGSYIDVVGSSSAGLKTLWINRHSARPEAYGPGPSAVLKSLIEVPEQLRG